MKIKAVLYDLGDIFFEAHYWRKWMYEYFFSKNIYKGTFKDFYFLYDSYLADTYNGKSSYEECFDRFISEFNLIDPSDFKTLSFSVKKEFETNRVLYEGVKETLIEIQNREILNIIITDNEATEQEIKNNVIARFGINEYIDAVITSKDAGVSKPDSKIFKIALSRFNLYIDEVLFVAHDIDEINGANKLGIKTVEYNNYLGLATNADYKINHFFNLLSIISI